MKLTESQMRAVLVALDQKWKLFLAEKFRWLEDLCLQKFFIAMKKQSRGICIYMTELFYTLNVYRYAQYANHPARITSTFFLL